MPDKRASAKENKAGTSARLFPALSLFSALRYRVIAASYCRRYLSYLAFSLYADHTKTVQ
jgi:hypothetical protein